VRKSLTKRWTDVLKKRQAEVAKVRDSIVDDIDEMDGLKSSCDRAYDDLQSAINALSELA
jgi:hypothetical protein